ncbi:DUF4230 domain-containing protein [Sphingomonas mucosissima]|uniref:DUF4230 domain-containing protein n=1 Tax=Sphingomonas mucosissima TaxID=370959 RepID=A0A245ZDQ1_9SPHN|nr:DUF4230 domain-containing protein [Sphingomonas mucosissima]OWK27786.1 hypothetical protein SPMU_33300 [Sphingomonas mucosissima]
MNRDGTLKNAVLLVTIIVGLALTVAIGVATYLGYRYVTEEKLVSTDKDGVATAQVVAATLYGRSDLRVSQLSGVVQGTARSSRLWGWLNASQVVKAPFEVNYFVNLSRLDASDFRMSEDGRRIEITVPDVTVERPNVDLARTSLNNVAGVFVTRSAMAEMGAKVAASAQRTAAERANNAENRAKARDYGRQAIARLFAGALSAARVDAQVSVRFEGEAPPANGERWDESRSLKEVLAKAQ